MLANDAMGATVASFAVPGGATGAVGQALQGSLGRLTMQANGAFTYEIGAGANAFTALAEGQTAVETFTYIPTVNGTAGAAQTLTITVIGLNDTPVAAADSGGTTTLGAPITGNVLSNDTDPDAAAVLAVTSVRAGAGQTAQAVQGAKATGLPTVVGTYGTLTMQSDGSYSYAIDAADADFLALKAGTTGTEVFTYTVSDGKLSTTATLEIAVSKPALAAKLDTASVTEDAPITVTAGNVLANDTGGTGTLKVVTVNGQAALVGQTIQTAYGSVVINADGTFTYTLNNAKADTNGLFANATSTESILYQVSDSDGGLASQQLLVTVHGANDAPTTVLDTGFVTEDAATNIIFGNVLTNDSDPDNGDTLRVTEMDGGPIGVTRQGIYGSIILNADGSYTYTLNNFDPDTDILSAGQTVFDDFTYLVSDGKGGATAGLLRVAVAGASTVITGTAGNDSLTGTLDNDLLSGLDGDDVLAGLVGADTIDGGTGFDTADYSLSPSAVTVQLGVAMTASGGHAQGDTLSSIEAVVGSAFGDRLTGDTGANTLEGGAGNDILVGSAGDDILRGGDGDDSFTGDGGADQLFGGNGIDTARYSGSSAGVTVNLATGVGAGGDAEGDMLAGIENVVGTGGNDILTGNDQANVLIGGTGINDLFGGLGDDLLIADRGADELHGQGGNDRLVKIATSESPVTTLNGGAGADQFILAVTPAHGHDPKFGSVVIQDFSPGTDRLDLSDLFLAGGAPASFDDIVAATSDTGAHLQISLSGFRNVMGGPLNGIVRLEGIADISALSASDFVLGTGPQWEVDLPIA